MQVTEFKFIPCLIIVLISSIYFTGCSSSSGTEEKRMPEENTKNKSEEENTLNSVIINTAKTEQENPMYSPDVDSTFLYWIDDELLLSSGSTKCNIYALNVLYRSGYKTPEANSIAADLYDTALFADILPVIGVNDFSNAMKGDLMIWNYHVIIFDELIKIDDEYYALAWWAGTRQPDNGENIKNNVCYGKYRLNGDFVVRRPVKK